MTTKDKLKILKIIRITLLIVFIPTLLFYLIIIVPDYIACLNYDYEKALELPIGEDKDQYFGENKELTIFFFNLSTMIFAIFSITLAVVFYLVHHLKRKLK